MSTQPNSRDVAKFRSLVAERLGLHFDASALDSLQEVLHRHVKASGGACSAYLEGLVSGSGADLQALSRDLTVTETFFFRGADHFTALRASVLPERLAAAAGRRLQVLSAGCASGEEAYSLAIAVREAFPHLAAHIDITAFDINPAALDKAQRARYSAWSLREASAPQTARWFENRDGDFVLDAAVRQSVAFHRRNLAQDDAGFWQAGPFDIVFCRNVLMYFTPEQARAAVRRIAQALAPGGYLFLGHAESLRGLSEDFELCHAHETFYYRRKTDAAVSTARASGGADMQAAASEDPGWVEAIGRSTRRINALAVPASAASGLPAAQVAHAAPELGGILEHLHNEQFDLALEQLGALPAAHARESEVLLLKAVALCHTAARDAAQALCRELLGRDPLHAGAHYVLALCCEGAGDPAGAVDHHAEAASLDAGFAMPHLHLGLLAKRRGDPAQAQRELRRAIALLPGESPARLRLFGGGFGCEALVALCLAECAACKERA